MNIKEVKRLLNSDVDRVLTIVEEASIEAGEPEAVREKVLSAVGDQLAGRALVVLVVHPRGKRLDERLAELRAAER